jgi:hypothetical protein
MSGDVAPHGHLRHAEQCGCVAQAHDVLFGERIGKGAQAIGFEHRFYKSRREG